MIRYRGQVIKFGVQALKPDALAKLVELERDNARIQSVMWKHQFTNPLRRALSSARQTTRAIVRSVTMIDPITGHETAHAINKNDYAPAVIRRLHETHLQDLRDRKRKYRQATPTLRPTGDLYSSAGRSRYDDTICRDVLTFGSGRHGYVFAEAGQIARLALGRRSKRLFEPVKPMTSERHLSVEIECGTLLDHKELGIELLDLAGYVMVKHDASVRVDDRKSVELNLCAPESVFYDKLRRLCEVLNSPKVGAKVNKTCGLHVHLDMRDAPVFETVQERMDRLMSVQAILYNTQPKSRQDNSYCKRSKSRAIIRGGDRYLGLNGQAYYKFRTLEVRLHAGTVDYAKIANWVQTLYQVCYSTAPAPKRAFKRLASATELYSIPTRLVEYLTLRIRKFADQQIEESEDSEAMAE